MKNSNFYGDKTYQKFKYLVQIWPQCCCLKMADRKKSFFHYNYWWAGINNYICSKILMITKIYIFLLPYFTSVLLQIMRSQPASNGWTVTFTAAFYHGWSYTEHYELGVLYAFDINIVYPYEICKFFYFWFDKRQRYITFMHA